MKHTNIFQLTAFLAGITFGACSSGVRVKTRSGHSLKGRVVHSEIDYVVVEQPHPARPGARQRVVLPRKDIVDVSHPGEALQTVGPVLAVAGAALAVGGLLVFASGHEDDCMGRTRSEGGLLDLCIDLDFTPIIEGAMIGTGAGLVITGLVLRLAGSSSVSASEEKFAANESQTAEPLVVEPVVGLSPSAAFVGVKGAF